MKLPYSVEREIGISWYMDIGSERCSCWQAIDLQHGDIFPIMVRSLCHTRRESDDEAKGKYETFHRVLI